METMTTLSEDVADTRFIQCPSKRLNRKVVTASAGAL